MRVEAFTEDRRQSVWIGLVCEDPVHDRCAAADGGDDHVAVDGLRDMGRLVSYRVADVLDRDAVVAHDRDGGVTSLVGVPVTDARSQRGRLVILLNRQLRASLVYG